jgi:hypothetical protein
LSLARGRGRAGRVTLAHNAWRLPLRPGAASPAVDPDTLPAVTTVCPGWLLLRVCPVEPPSSGVLLRRSEEWSLKSTSGISLKVPAAITADALVSSSAASEATMILAGQDNLFGGADARSAIAGCAVLQFYCDVASSDDADGAVVNATNLAATAIASASKDVGFGSNINNSERVQSLAVNQSVKIAAASVKAAELPVEANSSSFASMPSVKTLPFSDAVASSSTKTASVLPTVLEGNDESSNKVLQQTSSATKLDALVSKYWLAGTPVGACADGDRYLRGDGIDGTTWLHTCMTIRDVSMYYDAMQVRVSVHNAVGKWDPTKYAQTSAIYLYICVCWHIWGEGVHWPPSCLDVTWTVVYKHVVVLFCFICVVIDSVYRWSNASAR